MKKYECMVIMDPDKEKDTKEDKLQQLKEIIEKNGSIEKMDDWGIRKLAYKIKKKAEGHYFVIQFTSSPKTISDLKKQLNIETDYLRYLILRR